MVNDPEGDRPELAIQSPRAIRLLRQAGNCLDIALEIHDPPFVADLIDEAARLAGRAREISGKD